MKIQTIKGYPHILIRWFKQKKQNKVNVDSDMELLELAITADKILNWETDRIYKI